MNWELSKPIPKTNVSKGGSAPQGQKPGNFTANAQGGLPTALNLQNIFSQDKEFYNILNNAGPASNNNNQGTPNLNIKKEETQQINNFLNILGFQFQNNKGAGLKDFPLLESNEPSSDNYPKSSDLLMRAKSGVYLVKTTSKSLDDPEIVFVCKENSFAAFTKEGDFIIASDQTSIVVFECLTKVILFRLTKTNIQNIGLSNAKKHLIVVDKLDKENFKIEIYLTPTLEKVAEIDVFKYKRDSWPILKFDEEDSLCFRYINGDLEIRETKNFEIINKIRVNEIDLFYLSPKKENLSIVCVLNEHIVGYSKTDAKLSIWDYKNVKEPVFSKVMEKAQEMTIKWSPSGTSFLLHTQTMHDESGQSYYGQAGLYYYELEKKELKKLNIYSGPVHDVAWNPNNEGFIVISGFMPANSVLFDKNCNPIFEFGKHHRNNVAWSPLSRFMCLGGFGNLNGEMEIWDTITRTKVGECKSNSAVTCVWAPDGRQIMTAVLNPRLRVDNNMKIFKYNGEQTNIIDMSNTELYEVIWKPSIEKFVDRPASPNSLKKAQAAKPEGDKAKKIFVPKGGGVLAAMLKAEKNVQGARVLGPNESFGNEKQEKNDGPKYPPGYIPPPEVKPKKKRIRKKKDKTEESKEGEAEDHEND